MRIDLEKVDSQIKKLQELKRIASDPELMYLLEAVIVRNGNSPAELNSEKHTAPPAEPIVRNAVINPDAPKRKGFLLNAIKDAALRHTESPFSGYTLADKMIAEGFKFSTDKPGLAVNDSLRSLVKKGIVRVFKKGRGSEATLYEPILL